MTTCPADCGTDSPDGLLCRTCVTRLERDLAEVPSIVKDLQVTISRQARIGSGGKGGLASERTPVHLGAVAVADDLTNTLTTWARDVTTWVPAAFAPNPALRATKVLLSHVDLIRRHPAVAELVDEITDAIRQARRVVDRPADRVYLGQCYYEENDQTCFEELYANPGASEVRCKVCGVTHEVGERRAWLLRRASDMLFTVEQASQMLGEVGGIRVTQASIRGYIHRKRIAYRPGGKTIRLGDLIDVVMDESERRTA